MQHASHAGRVLGRAFTTDPVFTWLMQGRPQLERRLSLVFSAFAAGALRKPDAQVLVRPDNAAASIWLPPHGWRTPVTDVLRQAPQLLRAFGTGTPRALSLLSSVEKHHPAEPHWYLEAIGTVPEASGKGIGPSVLRPVLEHCDPAGLPATSRARTLATSPSTSGTASSAGRCSRYLPAAQSSPRCGATRARSCLMTA